MPSFDVRPIITLTDGGKDVSVAAQLSWQHKDNTLGVRVSDSCFKDGVSTNGLSLGIKNDRLEAIYDLSDDSPSLRLNTHVQARDKRVDLVYRNAVKAGASSLEAKVSVDDNNTAGVVYDLSNFDKPNHRNMTLKWTHVRDDLEITPSYNLGTESLGLAAAYRVDDENRLKATYCMNSNVGTLEWTNSAGTGGGGDLRITASANLADADSAKQVPTLKIEKTWNIDA